MLGPQRNLAKSSALKLITSFGDQGKKAKFFAAGDGGQTPIAAGVTPIAESAVSPGGHEPNTAFIRPSQRSAFNTPSSAKPPAGFNRQRLPSIGEIPRDDRPRDLLTGDDLATPLTDTASEISRSTYNHSRNASTEEPYSAGISLSRAATASPQMVRDSRRTAKDPPPPSPSPESLNALMQQGRSSRNGARDRMPEGMELRLHPLDVAMNGDITSPEQSVASSTRFHWPSRRRGPASVASSVTSASSVGRGYRSNTVGSAPRNANDYIHSLDAAQHYSKKGRSRENSRHRGNEDRVARGRDESRSRKTGAREASEDRGRSISRQWTPKPAKRSPTSPVPMSPEDLINLSTPSQTEDQSNEEGAVSIGVEGRDPSTVRKASQIRRVSPPGRVSSRASSRRRRSQERKPLTLEIRGRSQSRGDGSLMRSPSSPLPMSAQAQFYGASDDEEDYRAALEAKEQFRNRHNRSGSLKDPSSPAVGRRRDRSESRHRKNKTPAEHDQPPMPAPQLAPVPKSRSTSRAGDLKLIIAERQAKKEAAARELEERRKSLARRPSAPPIPHPDELSPIMSRPPSAFELPQTTFVPPKDMPVRSHTADHTRSSFMRNGNRPTIGLPATPKAMRLKFESDDRSVPKVPAIPTSARTSPPSSAKASPNKPNKSAENSPTKLPEGVEGPSLTLLPSTVYSPPQRPHIDRCMSAPIPEEPHGRGSYAHSGFPMGMQAGNKPPRRGSVSRKMSADATVGMADMRGIDEMLGASQHSSRHSRKASRDDQIPPPPPPPPVLKELQHLATPPPPPPAPLPGLRPSSHSSSGSSSSGNRNIVSATPGGGTIEVVMDDDDQNTSGTNAPAAAPMSEATVPIIAPPAPPTGRSVGHSRGRSITESSSSIAGRISRATERLRSASRGRNNSSSASALAAPRGAKSPDQTSPYESLPTVSYNPQQQQQMQQQMIQQQQQQQQQNIERHPREVRAAYQQRQEFGTGLLESEMI